MEVVLAGFNIDAETTGDFARLNPDRLDLTPETVAAAYARISRSPKAVTELRRLARSEVEKARASNRTIVFEMGHSSIAEHAVFNVDVLAVSRLAVEEIEHFRLASYTEKSQRYVLLKDDFVVPEEVKTAGLEGPFRGLLRRQIGCYEELFAKLCPYVYEQNPELAADPANRPLLEGWAKEDARYILPLAVQTQLGMTINARSLELMIRRLAASPLAETRDFSRRLYEATKGVAPSLVRYTKPTAYDSRKEELCRHVAALRERGSGAAASPAAEQVQLLEATPQADERIAAALIHGASSLPLAECLRLAAGMGEKGQRDLIKTALYRLESYDSPPREFEHVSLTFELVVSASCFAQLKRHRMASLTVQEYDPALGVTVPESIRAVGMEGKFLEVCSESETLWEKIRAAAPAAAPAALTNAHRRRALLTINARELYHIARVRADIHAQWDIRRTVQRMVEEARKVMPLTLLLASGKDGFADLYRRVFADGPTEG